MRIADHLAHPSRESVEPLLKAALREDAAEHDATSNALFGSEISIRARIIAKASGVLAGGRIAAWTLTLVDHALRYTILRAEGHAIDRGDTVMTLEGCARSIFAAERVALNLLCHLSGIATLTRRFVQHARPYHAQILDTRKTLPGLRALQKYAVRAGGGHSHRMDLADAILIKTNHLKVLRRGTGGHGRAIDYALARARRSVRGRLIGIEVATLAEFRAALVQRPGFILLDNWSLPMIRQAVGLRKLAPHSPSPLPLLEVSGGVTLENVREIAKTGVDRISIGRLTHSAPALDFSLEVVT